MRLMGAIFGFIGDGSLAEVRAMGQRVSHRGEFQQAWSPAPGVYFGQASQKPFEVDASFPLATDCHVVGGESSIIDLVAPLEQQALAALRGAFAFAICDGPGRVALAVDHVGYKSLFYTVLRGRFAFASEYKSLLALPDVPLEPDCTAIQQYLATMQPLCGRSFLARIRSLAGGQILHWRNGRGTIGTYWRPSVHVVKRTPQAHAAVLRDALLETVHRQVHNSEAVGITLGGGVDAAIVLGAIRRVAPDVRVSSFTIGGSADDWEIVGGRETAQAFGTEHHEYIFDPSVIPTELPRLVWLTEDCGGREEAMLQMHVLQKAGLHTRTIFGGHGADILFGGMPRHRLVGLAERLPLLSTPLHELFQLSQAGVPPSTYSGRALATAVYGRTRPQPLRVPGSRLPQGLYWQPELNQFIGVTIQRMHSFNYLEPQHELAGATFHSPFLDPDLIATSLTVPGRLKSGWYRQKRVLRQAAAGLLPATILRRKKAIQRLDVHGALGGVLADLAGHWLLGSALEQHQLVRGEQLQELRRERNRAQRNRQCAERLWSALSLECWARQFLDPRRASNVATGISLTLGSNSSSCSPTRMR
jgi:asparagine synthase (glutamine-hydrolysing)